MIGRYTKVLLLLAFFGVANAEMPADIKVQVKALEDWGDGFNMRLAYIKMQAKAFKSL
jgi:hypothetical protein